MRIDCHRRYEGFADSFQLQPFFLYHVVQKWFMLIGIHIEFPVIQRRIRRNKIREFYDLDIDSCLAASFLTSSMISA